MDAAVEMLPPTIKMGIGFLYRIQCDNAKRGLVFSNPIEEVILAHSSRSPCNGVHCQAVGTYLAQACLSWNFSGRMRVRLIPIQIPTPKKSNWKYVHFRFSRTASTFQVFPFKLHSADLSRLEQIPAVIPLTLFHYCCLLVSG